MKKRNELNKAQAARDEILKPFTEKSEEWAKKVADAMGVPYHFDDQFYRFEDLDLETLKLLIAMDFADLDDRQNEGPSIMELVKFGKDKDITFSGYAVGASRDDYRISIDEIKGYNISKYEDKLMKLFDKHHPDEYNRDGEKFRAWWD